MADVLELVFNTFVSESERPAAPPPPRSSSDSSSSSVLVVGGRSLSRSLLLLAAVTAASELGLRVVFFTRTQIQSLPAVLQNRVPSLNPESLKRLRFSYPRSLDELLLQAAALHESVSTGPAPPSLVLVDGLDAFLSGPGASGPGEPDALSRAAHLAALLCDTAAFLTQLLRQRAPGGAGGAGGAGHCRVIASFQPEEAESGRAGAESASDAPLEMLDRYFLVRCTLDPEPGDGPEQLWHVYLSGRGITEPGRDGADRPAVARERRLLVSSDGLMEFQGV